MNQIFECWKEDLVGITGLCSPVVTNCFWPTCATMAGKRNSISSSCWSRVLRSLSGRPVNRKVFARACLALLCVAPRGVGDMCLVCRERVLSDDVGPCGYRLHSACWQTGSGCRSCVVAPNTIDFAFIAENSFMSQCCALR